MLAQQSHPSAHTKTTSSAVSETRTAKRARDGSTRLPQNAAQASVSMTPLDLAKVRAKTREVIQKAIESERQYGSLDSTSVEMIQTYKYIADVVHLQIQELIEVRPPIMTMVVPVPCTFHWLAHYLYGDMNRAAEIRRLNQDIQNPALLLKGMEITVYAR